mgnify:FL=1
MISMNKEGEREDDMKDLIDELLECTYMQEVSMNARFGSYEMYVFNRKFQYRRVESIRGHPLYKQINRLRVEDKQIKVQLVSYGYGESCDDLEFSITISYSEDEFMSVSSIYYPTINVLTPDLRVMCMSNLNKANLRKNEKTYRFSYFLNVLEALNRKSFSFERMLMEREIFTESEYGLEVRKGFSFPVRKKDLDYFFVSGQDFKQNMEFIQCVYFDKYHH